MKKRSRTHRLLEKQAEIERFIRTEILDEQITQEEIRMIRRFAKMLLKLSYSVKEEGKKHAQAKRRQAQRRRNAAEARSDKEHPAGGRKACAACVRRIAAAASARRTPPPEQQARTPPDAPLSG